MMHTLSGGPEDYKVIRTINQPAMRLILLAERSAGGGIFKNGEWRELDLGSDRLQPPVWICLVTKYSLPVTSEDRGRGEATVR